MNGCKKFEYWVRQKKVREQFWVWDKPGACFAEGGGDLVLEFATIGVFWREGFGKLPWQLDV